MAVDTVLAFSTQAAASAFPTALAATTGDSLQVRGTSGDTKAHLLSAIFSADATGNKFRITSPLLHDNVTGLTWKNPDNPAAFLVPDYSSVELNELDTLGVNGQCGAATTITAGLVIAYDDVRGQAADLYRWSDISPDIRYIKAIEVSLNAIAVGAWTDTAITNTEDQMHANKSYAILGYVPVPAVDIVGIKGIATGNLRFCGPGLSQTLDIANYFIRMSELHQRPLIPVVQSNDRKGIFVSAAHHAAVGAGAAEVFLNVAELKSTK